MDKKRIIVSIENGLTPKKVLGNSIADMRNVFARMHSIDGVVKSFRDSNIDISNTYENNEVMFSEEVLFTLSVEEQDVYSVFISHELEVDRAAIILTELEQIEQVKYVQYDEENTLYEAPDDPYYPSQWGLQKVNCEQAWNYSKGENVIIAVLDTGIDYNNPDIEPNLWKDTSGNYGYDFANTDTDTMDYKGHGTHVAGIIGALNNKIMIASVAPKSQIMSVKIFPRAYDSVCAKAIKYAVDNGAQVINNSWGPKNRRPSNRVVEGAIDYAYSKGVINVFAAGNDNDDIKYYSPANHQNVITVGSTTKNDARSSTSNYGKHVRICAPGSSILSLKLNSSLATRKSGTSMAAPFISGAVGLILSINPETSSTDVVLQKIEQYSDTISTDKPIGKRLNAGKIVFNDPVNFILFEAQLSDTHRGVTGCCGNRQNQARSRARRWFTQIKRENPNLNEVYSGHGSGRAECRSGRTSWPDNERWCRTTVRFRAYIMMHK